MTNLDNYTNAEFRDYTQGPAGVIYGSPNPTQCWECFSDFCAARMGIPENIYLGFECVDFDAYRALCSVFDESTQSWDEGLTIETEVQLTLLVEHDLKELVGSEYIGDTGVKM